MRISGTTIRVPVSCKGSTSCTVKLSLTVTETIKGGKVSAVTAKKHKTKTRLVTVARVTTTITAGHSKPVKIALNAAPGQEAQAPRQANRHSGQTDAIAKTLTFRANTAGRHKR